MQDQEGHVLQFDNADMSEPNGQSSSHEVNEIFNVQSMPIEDDLNNGLNLEGSGELEG